jgi:phosphoribosylpyrophosphate synthetase
MTIAFPDEGACKRFGGLWHGYETVICSKVRTGEKRNIEILSGNCRGRHVVIVDDLVKTGGTLLECANKLFEHGAVQVSACVTHAVFPQESWKRFLDANFSFFWVTNSIPTTTDMLESKRPFEVLSLARPICSVLSNCVVSPRL